MKSRAATKSNGWSVVVFENEHSDDRIAYTVGPFTKYEQAIDWAEQNEDDYEVCTADMPVEMVVQS